MAKSQTNGNGVLEVQIRGVAPLLMHSDRPLNPLDPLTKEQKALAAQRNKTDAIIEELKRLGFLGALYHDEKLGPYIPNKYVKGVLIGGAKKNKKGAKFKSSVAVAEHKIPLQYDGPRDKDELYLADGGKFCDYRSVQVQRNRIMRARPIFDEWSCKFTILYDPDEVNEEDVLAALQLGGKLCGLGDYRPDYGRFEVVRAS